MMTGATGDASGFKLRQAIFNNKYVPTRGLCVTRDFFLHAPHTVPFVALSKRISNAALLAPLLKALSEYTEAKRRASLKKASVKVEKEQKEQKVTRRRLRGGTGAQQ